jgi:hypothetical protein
MRETRIDVTLYMTTKVSESSSGRYTLRDIVLGEFHPGAEKATGEDHQDPRKGAAASDCEAREKPEGQVEKYVCDKVTPARRLRPTL